MPNESVNLFLSIQSGSSEQALVSLTDKTKALDKETQLLKQATEALTKANAPLMEEQKKLQDQIRDSTKTIKELEDAYKESGDELSRVSLDKAREQHAALKAELSGVNAQISTNQKTYKEYLETVRKGGLIEPSSGTGGDSSGMDLSSVWGGLGIGQQLSALATQASSALLESALGSGVGGIASGALSNAITGASLGTAIAPGIGTAIGGAIGMALGAAGGAMEEWGNQDDAFKDYYGGLYDDVKGRSGEMVEAGSTLASTRDSDLKSFSTLMDGNTKAAKRFQDALIEIGRTPPFSYDSVSEMSKNMISLGLSTDDVTERISALGEAAAALDLSESGVSTIVSTLESAQLSGKLEGRVLKTLSRQGINVYEALADEFGMTEADVAGNAGDLDVERAVKAIYDYMGNHFSDASAGLTDTYSGISGILESYQEDLNALGGDGYNALRKGGLEEEVNALSGSLGDAIGEINAIMGENQARRENLEDQYMREVLDMVLNGHQGSLWEKFDEKQQNDLTKMSQQYSELKAQYEASGGTDWEAGVELEKLYETAQTLGTAYFENSDEVALLNDIEQDEVQAILDATAGLKEATTASYYLAEKLSLGLAGTAQNREKAAETANTLLPGLAAAGMAVGGDVEGAAAMLAGKSNAFGLDRVPYDEYPALLHQGERVLTASEARAQDAGQGTVPIQIPISGNTFMGLPEEVADQIAEILARKLTQAAIAAVPK